MLEKVELLKKKGNISHGDIAKLGLGGDDIIEEDNEAEPVPLTGRHNRSVAVEDNQNEE